MLTRFQCESQAGQPFVISPGFPMQRASRMKAHFKNTVQGARQYFLDPSGIVGVGVHEEMWCGHKMIHDSSSPVRPHPVGGALQGRDGVLVLNIPDS